MMGANFETWERGETHSRPTCTQLTMRAPRSDPCRSGTVPHGRLYTAEAQAQQAARTKETKE
jgi:hypothetical protein